MPTSLTVKQLITGQTVVTISVKDSIQQAIEKLSNKNITSAPVLGDQGKIYGTKEMKSNVSPSSTKLTTDDIGIISSRSATFYVSSILEIFDQFPRHDPYYPLHENQTLKDAIPIFLRSVHRIAVTDAHNKITGILTQSNVIQWLSQETSRMGLKAQLEVSKMNTKYHTSPVSIGAETIAIEAFQTMNAKKVTSLAIVDQNGALLGTISASDLKGLKDMHFFRLLMPIMNFLHEVRKEQNKKADYVVTCAANSELKTVVTRIAHEHVHRVFVVDNQNKPIGVLSATDIIRETFGNTQ